MHHNDDLDSKAPEDLLDLHTTNLNSNGEYEPVEFATLREVPEHPSPDGLERIADIIAHPPKPTDALKAALTEAP